MLALLMAGLTGCGALEADPQVEAEVRGFHDDLTSGRLDATRGRFDPSALGPTTSADLVALADYVPAGTPRAFRMMSRFRTTSLQSGEREAVTYELDYGDEVVRLQADLRRPDQDSPWRLWNIHYKKADAAELRRQSAFSIFDKPVGQIVFLTMAILSPLLMVGAAVKVALRKGLRRKWLWMIIAFVGMGTLAMNWANGELSFNPLQFGVLGFGITKLGGAFAAWVVTMTLPVGALLILFGVWANPARAKVRKSPDEAAEPTAPSGGGEGVA